MREGLRFFGENARVRVDERVVGMIAGEAREYTAIDGETLARLDATHLIGPRQEALLVHWVNTLHPGRGCEVADCRESTITWGMLGWGGHIGWLCEAHRHDTTTLALRAMERWRGATTRDGKRNI